MAICSVVIICGSDYLIMWCLSRSEFAPYCLVIIKDDNSKHKIKAANIFLYLKNLKAIGCLRVKRLSIKKLKLKIIIIDNHLFMELRKKLDRPSINAKAFFNPDKLIFKVNRCDLFENRWKVFFNDFN